VNTSMALLAAHGKIPAYAHGVLVQTDFAVVVAGVEVVVVVEVHRRRIATVTVSATEMETENLEADPGTTDPTTTEMIRNEIGVVVDGNYSISSHIPCRASIV
jgi:hypothetical protein